MAGEFGLKYFIVIFLFLKKPTQVLATTEENRALFEYVTIELLSREEYYLTMLPRNISHQFNVSFVFPNVHWSVFYEDRNSDPYHCFKDQLRRKLKQIYYKDNVEYVDAKIIRFRNESEYSTYITADFSLKFIKTLLWPAWNLERVAELFPDQLKGLMDIYPYPEVRDIYHPFVNYTGYEIEWFKIIADEKNMFGYKEAFAFYGIYDYVPPAPTYDGPVYFSPMNTIFYGLLGFNFFVILFALVFWRVNGNRNKLLLTYWFKEKSRVSAVEPAPGDM